MRNPFGPRTSRLHRAVCQIVHVERASEGMLVDLVTLTPSARGRERLPAGTPLTLDFTSRLDRGGGGGLAALALLLARWEQEDAVVDLVVDDDPAGVRYELTSGHDRLTLFVDGGRPGP